LWKWFFFGNKNQFETEMEASGKTFVFLDRRRPTEEYSDLKKNYPISFWTKRKDELYFFRPPFIRGPNQRAMPKISPEIQRERDLTHPYFRD
jgi:hypothetical protein